MSSAKWRLFRLGLNELIWLSNIWCQSSSWLLINNRFSLNLLFEYCVALNTVPGWQSFASAQYQLKAGSVWHKHFSEYISTMTSDIGGFFCFQSLTIWVRRISEYVYTLTSDIGEKFCFQLLTIWVHQHPCNTICGHAYLVINLECPFTLTKSWIVLQNGRMILSFSGFLTKHYDDVIMSAIASQITSLTVVYSIAYSDADLRNHQSSASLAFVWGIHRGPVNSPHKWPVTRKMFPFDDVIMRCTYLIGFW